MVKYAFGSFTDLVLSCLAHMYGGHQPEWHNHRRHNTGQTAFPSTAVVVENSFNNVFGLGDINTVFKDGTVSCQNQISF